MNTPSTSKALTIVGLSIALSMGASLIASSANAETVINTKIKVSKSALRGKCKRSGGTYTEEADGSYGCAVNREDGGYTTVDCEDKNNCFGSTSSSRLSNRGNAKRLSNTSSSKFTKLRKRRWSSTSR